MATDVLPAGTRLGAYRIVEVLGRGGMGIVYKAEEERLGRPVALKVISRDLAADPAYMKRFEREARAASAVSHPNIATLLGAGEERGTTFLAFELVLGGTLKSRLAEKGRMEWREAARTGAQIASALAAIHEAGFVHRDLKPENVLLDQQGRPKLADFGLARHEASSSGRGSLTKTGDILGTPEYMSPEQADGAPVSARSDLYSLGATIHALVAGAPPFQGTGYTLLTQVLKRAPTPLGKLVPGVPVELERLVQSLLEKDPAARPAEAASVARRLDALGRDAVVAPGRRAAVALAVLLVVIASGLGGFFALRERPRKAPAPPAPPAARRTFQLVRRGTLEPTTSREWVTRIRADSSGRRCISGCVDGTARVWDLEKLELVMDRVHVKAVHGVDIDDRGRVITGCGDRTVLVWNLADRAPHEVGSHDGTPEDDQAAKSAAFSPDGKLAVTSGWSGTSIVWSLDTGAKTVLRDSKSHVHQAFFSEDGREIVTASGEGESGALAVWRLDDLRGTPRTWFFTAQVHGAASFGKTGKILAALKDGRIMLWDPSSKKEPELFGRHANGLSAAPVSPDGTLVASVAVESREGVRLWDSATRAVLADFVLPEPYWSFTDLTFAGNDRLLVGTNAGAILVLGIE